jgi:hypothetical protein
VISTIRNRRIPRPSAALVVSFAALFAAMSGTGYAALKVTGASIANNTVSHKDVKNKTLRPQDHKPNSLTGAQIDESQLGTVPQAAKASDADTVGGQPASAFMVKQTRAFEAPIADVQNFANDATLGTLPDLAPGAYVATAKLTYENDTASDTDIRCTLSVPGADDVTRLGMDTANAEVFTLQKVTSADAVFSPSVSCESDGSDDIIGVGNIIAVRVD